MDSSTNSLIHLRSFGQSIWLDFIRRGMLASGELQTMINEDGLLGVTSNPSIFEKSITGSHDYDQSIQRASLEGKSAKEIYDQLTIEDIQKTADLFLPTYRQTQGKDGFVSLEVSPNLARDTEGSIREARRLWAAVKRPNVMIKIPGTKEGLPAIRQLISEGMNINVTLLFGLDRYSEVLEAYSAGLEERLRQGKPIGDIASVASFFLSRIDTAVDPKLPANSPLKGQTAIACAKMAYQQSKNFFRSERFEVLRRQGAHIQRLLWASTSTKDPAESDVKYVEALIGPDTVNTLPLETLNAYRDHGAPASRLESDLAEVNRTFEGLRAAKIDLHEVTRELEEEGVQKFKVSFDKLMSALEVRRQEAAKPGGDGFQKISLSNCEDAVKKRVASLQQEKFPRRIWRKDATLWKNDPEAQKMIKNSLGWLHIAEKMQENLETELKPFVSEVKLAGFQHVVHMGMGGSSLAPLVLARSFGKLTDGLSLSVLDTTNPRTIQDLEKSLPLDKTLFIVASKSGTTAEPLAFRDYFFAKIKALKGDRAGENFVAITDPGTPLATSSKERKFRRVFDGTVDIGGRYSALSYFGIVPGALMGLDIRELLNRAVDAGHVSEGEDSPALTLGAALGEMASRKQDKITLLIDQQVESLGLWLEQLMAESTGKEGRGLIPIAEEPFGKPAVYSEDRLFVAVMLKDSKDENLKSTLSQLKQAGRPVVTLMMSDLYDLGRQFFAWEFATAVAGSVLQINAFDQPNVQESKDNTNRLLAQGKDRPATEAPKATQGSLSLYSTLQGSSAEELLKQYLQLVFPGDYVALMAFLPETPQSFTRLQEIRTLLRDQMRLATTLGYGPRFLHSTGQLHKGGPKTGVFLQLTADDVVQLAIPGKPYSFGDFKTAQAQGDFEALRKHGDRVMRIHLGADFEKGLQELSDLISKVLRTR